jgi:hypothetical protein
MTRRADNPMCAAAAATARVAHENGLRDHGELNVLLTRAFSRGLNEGELTT